MRFLEVVRKAPDPLAQKQELVLDCRLGLGVEVEGLSAHPLYELSCQLGSSQEVEENGVIPLQHTAE